MELNNVKIKKFNQMCRTCLNEGQLLTSLYDENDQNDSLVKKLEMCTSIKCNKNDGLPDKICPKCVDELFQSYNFVNKCKNNDASLKQCLKKQNDILVETIIENEVSYMNFDNDIEVEMMINKEYEDDLLFDMFNKVIENTGTRIIDTDLTTEITIKEEVEVIDLTFEEEEEQQNEITNLLNTEETNKNKIKLEQNEKSTKPSSCIEKSIEENESNQINDILIKAKQNLNENENKLEDTNINKINPEHDEKSTAPTSSIVNSMKHQRKETNYNNKKMICNDSKCSENQINETNTNMELPEQHKNSTVAATSSTTENSLRIQNKKINYTKLTIEDNETLAKKLCDSDIELYTKMQRLKSEEIYDKNKLHECEICSKKCTRSNDLNLHKKIHTRSNDLNLHKKIHTRSNDLNLHKKIHTGELPYKCMTCQKRFFRFTQLHRHTRQHTVEHPYKSQICSKTFIQSSDLNRPKIIQTREHPFKCEICSKTFIHSSNLTKHKRIHTGERPYKSQICSKTFIHSSNLTKHKIKHHGECPFKCEICSKTFIHSSNFTKHKRIHTGERPYKSQICSKTFIQSSDLNRPKIIQTREHPFKCEICSKTFIHFSNLTKHKRIHTGERPYKSQICSKTIIQSSDLNRPKIIQTRERPFKCEICEKPFNNSFNLYKHTRTHPPNIPTNVI